MKERNIKKLKKIPACEFWKSHESFKRWLANNLDVLEKPLGEKLELKDKHRHLEGNNIDIIAKPVEQEEKKGSFLILCKLKKLNKKHLDQILALQEKRTRSSKIILIATEFSQKLLNKIVHNRSKSSSFHIHLIKFELFEIIKTNMVVPLFRIKEFEEKKESSLESQEEEWLKRMEVFIWQ